MKAEVRRDLVARLKIMCVVSAMTCSLARADWRFEAETGGLYNSNLSNSDRAADVEEDWAWETNARLGNGFQLSRDVRLNVAADLRGQVWDRFDGLDKIGGGASADLRYRFGLGRLAPWISLGNRVGYDRFNETVRSGWDESCRFVAGMAISQRIALEAGYTFENFVVPDNFFDRQGHRASARAVFDLTSSLQIALEYTYREGDVISYALPPRPDIARIAIEREDITTFGNPPYTGYRLLGRTHAVSLSAGYAVTKYLSVEVSYEYALTTHDPLQYENHLVEAKIAFAY